MLFKVVSTGHAAGRTERALREQGSAGSKRQESTEPCEADMQEAHRMPQ